MTQRKRISLDDIPDKGKGNYTGKISFVSEKDIEEALEQVDRMGKNKADFCRRAMRVALEEVGLLPIKAS